MFLEYENCLASKILGELLTLTNKKDNDNDNPFNKLFCISDEKILNLEKKIFSFSSDKNYNYASAIINSENTLPKININLSLLKSFLKNKITNEKNAKNLQEEIIITNEFYSSLISNINLKTVGTIAEQSIIYYLFYFMSNILFYILLNPNFLIDKSNYEDYLTFFDNYHSIRTAAELYIEKKSINESNTLIISNNEIVDEYYELVNYKEEFQEIVEVFNNTLTIILYSIGYPNNEDNSENNYKKIDEKMVYLLEKFVLIYNIFHSVNEKYNIIDYQCFYNDSLSKHLNLEREFQIFLSNERKRKERENQNQDESISNSVNNEQLEFTLFNHTWLFDPSAKYEIINLFNENKQIQKVSNVNYNALSEFEQFIFLGELMHSRDIFFKLNIRRNNIIEDTLNEVSKYPDKLQYPLKVEFIDEEAEDEGGVRKEFFMLVTRKLFDVNYGMFTYNEKTRLFWFNLNSFEAKIKYELIGIVLGLALFNGVILDIKFPIAIYKKLLGIVPCLKDLKEYDPELYNSLNFLVNTNDKNLEENLDSNFTVSVDKFGEKITIPLKPNGENIMINFENKNEYVELYLNWFFNESIKEYYNSFETGFYKVFDKKLSKILSPQELELIICGTQHLDFNELQNAVRYEDYDNNSITIKFLWEILMEFNEEEKKKFLFFVTGCDRAPIGGLGSLHFEISRNGNIDELPSSHTCFNHLILPDYQNKELMKKKILTAINYSEGFGLK